MKPEQGHVDAATLVVANGKSAREKAERRVVPVSRHLLAEIAPYMGAPGELLVRRRRDLRAGVNRNHHPHASLSAAWAEATEAGEVRKEVWAPSTRQLARPDHAFRAAFQAALVSAGVRDATIDALVGVASQHVVFLHSHRPRGR